MKLMVDYLCPHCGATAVFRTGHVTVLHPSWCPDHEPRRGRRIGHPTGAAGAQSVAAASRLPPVTGIPSRHR